MTATDTLPVAHLQRLLEEVVEEKGIKKPRYTVSAGSKNGDNYIGLLYRVEVREGDAAEPVLRLIIKAMPLSLRRRQDAELVKFFDNEFSMYRDVLPALGRFAAAAAAGVDGGVVDAARPGFAADAFPYAPPLHSGRQECRGAGEGEDALVLEDMLPLGFRLQDRRVGLDVHHVRAVLRSLAYLHASSMAMEDQRPDEFAELRGLIKETLFRASNPFGPQIEIMAKKTDDYVKDRFPEGSTGYKRMRSLMDSYMKEMLRLSSPSPDGGNTICHGDCWTNNVLFKYSKSGDVEEACLLDFQISRYAPPVLDIAYLIFCCTTREFRDEHLDRLLGEYHDQLSANLRRFAIPDKVYPKKTMEKQMRERMCFGFGMAAMTVPLFLADSDEIPDMDEQFDKGTEIDMTIESRNAPERNKRIADVLEEMIDRGWL
ncbi:LOW QUALITY PROTEIN: putative oxidoreductase dhs-27 [Frankliniella fusca]|uniref:Oxidoreductase dhs-27 n=1 Tax=Frankliniella fusca TaxID=407009 RepID=A0AAE1H5U4_9NEOP|nr:LOW QUALITY PROTEIN: putative oxidoreductase dhs-27 [Frankliniella fusca]